MSAQEEAPAPDDILDLEDMYDNWLMGAGQSEAVASKPFTESYIGHEDEEVID
jgi:hypothetical protein